MDIVKPYDMAEIHYEKLSQIGAENGKNSSVFIVHDKQLDAKIVMKEIDRDNCDPNDFFREARILYSSAHEGIVQIYYCGQSSDLIHIAMPLYKNGCLKDKISNGLSLYVYDIIRYTLQVITAVHHIHSKGLVHLDIKPDNVLISDSDSALLSDFGVARHTNLDGYVERPDMYPFALPPEAFKSASLDSRADIYQVGLLLYRMMVGNDIFRALLAEFGGFHDRRALYQAISTGRFPPKEFIPEHIPTKLSKIVRKCLSVEPGDRYQAVLHVANDMCDITSENLDWSYSFNESTRGWSRICDGIKHSLIINHDGSSDCTKTIKDGTIRRVKEFTLPPGKPLAPAQIRRYLGVK